HPRHGQVPERRIQPEVLADSSDATSAGQAVPGRPPDDPTPQERLLERVIGPPEIIAVILRASRLKDISRRHGARTILRKAQRESLGRERQSCRLVQESPFHALDHGAEVTEALAHLERPPHYLLDHIASMQNPAGGEHADRDNKTVRANGPE